MTHLTKQQLEAAYSALFTGDKTLTPLQFSHLVGDHWETLMHSVKILIDAKTIPADDEAATVDCNACGGDGIERCDNPDHGLLNALSFRGANESRCPCCGHDEQYRMSSYKEIDGRLKSVFNKCPECSGTGKRPKVKAADLLWSELMDFCRNRGYAPSKFDDLFSIVPKIRAASQEITHADHAIYNWLNAHIKIEDLKTHPEWKALKTLLGVQE